MLTQRYLTYTLTLGATALGLGGCLTESAQPRGTGGSSAAGGLSGSATGGASTVGGGGAAGSSPGGSGTGGLISGSGGASVAGTSGTTAGGAGSGLGGSGGLGASGASGSGASGGASNAAGGSGGGVGGAAGASGAGGLGGAGAGGTGAGGIAGGPPIVDLFNGTDLTGWEAYRETQATSPGTRLTPTQALAIFKPEDGAIRVYGDAADQSTQARHTLVTTQSYSKYNFWLEYSWGTKVFAPYTDLDRYPRDAGILWHLHDDTTQVWPSSIELQIKDGTTGDIFALYARCTSLGLNGGTTYVSAADGGTMKVVDGANGFVQHGRSANFEVAGWNSLELRVNGGTAVYLVNGQVVNEVLSVNDSSGMTGSPVISGPIALQAEHAEVFYRNVRIQVLP